MTDNFFEPEVNEQEVEKIRLGEDEYTQEELSRLVGLGKIGDEAEKKYHTKIDRIWPQFQTVINEKKGLEDRLKQEDEIKARIAEQTKTPEREDPNRQLSETEIKDMALKQAEALGIGPQAIRNTVMELMQGQQLLTDINQVIDTNTGEGLPETTPEDIIKHMQDSGIRNPQKAYQDMFEKEWLASQAAKINSIKSNGMPTISSSTAGAKTPAPVKITSANLEQLVAESLAAGGN
jgi:hypothetical protein